MVLNEIFFKVIAVCFYWALKDEGRGSNWNSVNLLRQVIYFLRASFSSAKHDGPRETPPSLVSVILKYKSGQLPRRRILSDVSHFKAIKLK